jgi:hypothetical protein
MTWRISVLGTQVALCGLLLAALTLAMAACGGSGTPATVAPPPSISLPAPAEADNIAASYVMFFDGSRAVADKVGLLENGQQYASQLESLAASANGKALSIAINSLGSISASVAEVRFTLLVNGQPAHSEQTGKAVLQDGTWKVAAETFLAVQTLIQGFTPSSS